MARLGVAEIRLADAAAIREVLRVTRELTEELAMDLDDPFTMTPLTQDRLRPRLFAVQKALAAVEETG